MKKIYIITGVLWLACLFACTKDCSDFQTVIEDNHVHVSLNQYSDSSYSLVLKLNGVVHSEWRLNYPVYRFDYGDVTGNGIPDIGVGVIKTTRFDPKKDKRLFLFQITPDYYIRPLWLGSRVSQPLEDFCLRNNGHILTMEREKNGSYLLAAYKWRGFGLDFLQYEAREILYKEASKVIAAK